MDGKDLDIELDSTADSEKEDSEEEEDDDPFSNAPPRQEQINYRTNLTPKIPAGHGLLPALA